MVGIGIVSRPSCLTEITLLALTLSNTGAFVNEDQPGSDLNWDILKNNLKPEIACQAEVTTVPQQDVYETVRTFCNASSRLPYTAIIGPKSHVSTEAIESICSSLTIPYFLTHWSFTPYFKETPKSTFNLYPESLTFSQALVSIVLSLDWPKFVVVYENADSLSRLQDVLKIQAYEEGSGQNEIFVKSLGPGPDYRPLLKNITSLVPRRIILDCHVDKIKDILLQAKEVKLLNDLSTSIFLTSLDAHTLDYTDIGMVTNITTIRLFNPYEKQIQDIVSTYYRDISPEKLKVETALQHDSMLLLAKAVNTLYEEEPHLDHLSTFKECSGRNRYRDRTGIKLMQQLKSTEIDGLTGKVLIEEGQRTTFELEIIEIRYPEKPIGIWHSDTPQSVQLTRNATEREQQLQQRMMDHNFIVSSKIGKPYLMPSEIEGARGNDRYKGFSMDLMTEVAKLMDITFDFVITATDNPAGIVSDLINRRADLGICDLTITEERSRLIDFSAPFMNLGIAILHKEIDQEEIDNMYAFMRPFSWTVWIYTITLFLVLSIVILVIARLDPDDWENPHPCNPNPEELENIWGIKNCLWLTLGSFMTQGCDILPKGVCSRIATAMWWFFSLIMTSTYTANLAAFLTASKQEDSPIKDVEGLANQNKVKYGLMRGGSTQSFFEHSNNSLYQKMWATMKNENPSVFEDSNDKGVERVKNTKHALYAFLMESAQIEYEMNRRCDLKKVGLYLDSKSYGIGMPLGAVYRHKVNAAILTLRETGKILELKEKWWKSESGHTCDEGPGDDNNEALTLANVGGVFIVLGAGLGLAFLLAIIEFLWNVHSISVDEHMTYMEALKCELKFACNITVTKKAAKPVISESSSSSSGRDKSVSKTILAGAGSFLNINASVLNRLGHLRDLESCE
ncbi:glutamate receptor ionotropic, kainate 1-like isoform X2 [Anthonomus grandis grandis]|uniref:glutamate receptor ionotropic, kainate 1-like isoform X2 n=1 Tax=Anthonomus grandis grandis TaxID=2921223 RepID=UPI0021665C58|nr:glutamate receptor ionotropic, kainate 1-like isoform X2 [Anthonomus grandis grandis]